jgi:hypothetical protein
VGDLPALACVAVDHAVAGHLGEDVLGCRTGDTGVPDDIGRGGGVLGAFYRLIGQGRGVT